MKKISVLAGVFFFATGVFSAWADSTVESITKSGGFRGNGAYEGTVTSRLQGEKKYESSSIKFTGAVMSWLSGGSDTGTITRLDRGVIWTLDPKKKVYKEETIAPFNKDDAKQKPQGKEKPKARISRSEFSVKKTGVKETINGFPCEEYLIAWLLEFEDLETKAKVVNTMTTNEWTTPVTSPIRKLQADEAAFAKAYMKKLGLDFSQQELKQFGVEIFSSMSGAPKKEMEKQFKAFKKEMAKLKGYPIRTVVNWTLEGDSSAQAALKEESGASTINPLDILGGLMNSAADSAADRKKSAENKPFFSSTMEVKSIKVDALSPQTFEIPAGFIKE